MLRTRSKILGLREDNSLEEEYLRRCNDEQASAVKVNCLYVLAHGNLLLDTSLVGHNVKRTTSPMTVRV